MEFGELRSRLMQRQDSGSWALVRAWAEQAWDEQPERFEDEWLPYLVDQVRRWRPRVCDCPGHWKRRFAAGRFAPMQLVRALHFQADEPRRAEVLAAMATSPDLTSVETLSFGGGVFVAASREAELLAQASLPSLRTLELLGAFRSLSRARITTLAGASWLGQVERLDISGCEVSGDGLEGLWEAGLGASLVELVAAGLEAAPPGLFAEVLARAPRLERLDWRRSTLDVRGLEGLRGAAQLRELSLDGARLRAAEVGALCVAALPELRSLTLMHAGLTPQQGARVLEWASSCASLRVLNLAHNELDAGALVGLGALSGLRVLVLSYNPIRDEGARRIGEVAWTQLSALGVEGCVLSVDAMEAMLRTEGLRGLKTFAWGDNIGMRRAEIERMRALLGAPGPAARVQQPSRYLI